MSTSSTCNTDLIKFQYDRDLRYLIISNTITLCTHAAKTIKASRNSFKKQNVLNMTNIIFILPNSNVQLNHCCYICITNHLNK